MTNLTNIVDEELKLNQSKDGLALPIDFTNHTTKETAMTKALKLQLEDAKEKHVQSVATIAVEILEKSQELRERKIQQARELRSRAKELVAEATDLYNAEVTVIQESRIAPLAHLLQMTNYDQSVTIKQNLLKKPLKSYFQDSKKASKAVVSE